MRKILTLTMSGLVTVLPLALTVYVIWWLVHTVEGWLRHALIALGIVSQEHYWPGLGLIAGFLLLLIVGSLVNAYAGKILLKYWDDFLGRIPFVKTLYGGFRDVVSLLPSGSGEKRDLQRVVLARFADVHAIGFVTREDVPSVLHAHGGQDWVTVYFPMSYAFGGYTIYLPRDRIQPLDISVEDAMRLAITAGLTAAGSRAGTESQVAWSSTVCCCLRSPPPTPRTLPRPKRTPARNPINTRPGPRRPRRSSVPAGMQTRWPQPRLSPSPVPDSEPIRRDRNWQRWIWPHGPANSRRRIPPSAGCACSFAPWRPPATRATLRPSCVGSTRTMLRPGCRRWLSRSATRTRPKSTEFWQTWPASRTSISTGIASWYSCSMRSKARAMNCRAAMRAPIPPGIRLSSASQAAKSFRLSHRWSTLAGNRPHIPSGATCA